MYTCRNLSIPIYIYAHTCIYIYIYTYIHAHAYIYIYVYMSITYTHLHKLDFFELEVTTLIANVLCFKYLVYSTYLLTDPSIHLSGFLLILIFVVIDMQCACLVILFEFYSIYLTYVPVYLFSFLIQILILMLGGFQKWGPKNRQTRISYDPFSKILKAPKKRPFTFGTSMWHAAYGI